MEIKNIKDEGLQKNFSVNIPAKEVLAEINKTLTSIAGTIKMAGFRAGKVPLSIVSKKYGPTVRLEAIENQIKSAIRKVIEDGKFSISTEPKIEDLKAEEGKDLSFTLMLETYPAIDPVDLSKAKIKKPVLKVSEADIDEYIQKLIAENPVFSEEKKGKSAEGDQVTIDFEGSVNGKLFDGGTSENYKLVLGSKSFIPGFEDQLVGHKAGDEVEVKVKFPENYHSKDLAGKDAVFKTKIHEIHKPGKLTVDDALGKFFGFEDLAALKHDVIEMLKRRYSPDIMSYLKMQLFDFLEKQLKFDVPASMLDNEFETIKKRASGVIGGKASEEDNEEPSDSKKKPVKGKKGAKASEEGGAAEWDDDEYRRIALRRVRIGLFISNLAKEKGITLDNRDLNNAITNQARMFPGSEQFIMNYYRQNKEALESLKGSALEDKTVTYILEKEAKVEDKEYEGKEMTKFLEAEMKDDI